MIELPPAPPEGRIFSAWSRFLEQLSKNGAIKLSSVALSELIKAFYAGYACGAAQVDEAMRVAAQMDDEEDGARVLGSVVREIRTEVERFSNGQRELAVFRGGGVGKVELKGKGNGN